MKHKPLKYPKSRNQLAKRIAWLSEHMIDTGTTMQVMAGCDARRAAQGRLLVEAGMIYAVVAEEERG